MSLCKRFVEINQGQITVSSKEGVGTTFKVQLPSVQESHEVHTEHHSSSEAKLV
ncbi:histidine kinase-, DNA gyrase B-, and HSP90-like ATPase family protein [Acinetobacter pittii]|nr:histidine kinase-, DNA gyrase B-, and HSP90-like ATPase family protein [Acinetobacter pittii]